MKKTIKVLMATATILNGVNFAAMAEPVLLPPTQEELVDYNPGDNETSDRVVGYAMFAPDYGWFIWPKYMPDEWVGFVVTATNGDETRIPFEILPRKPDGSYGAPPGKLLSLTGDIYPILEG